jgi:hypothetical protein
MTKLNQIIITKCEEPIDQPRGEVFCVELFDGKKVVDIWHHGQEEEVLDTVKTYLEDLTSR